MKTLKTLLNRKLFLTLIVLWTISIGILRAFGLPNNYSQSHWLLDYRFGFMKRGLIGSICSIATSIFGTSLNSEMITVLSTIMYAGFIVAFLYIIFRLLQKYNYDDNISIIVLIFSSSPFFVASANLFGYFDSVLYIAVIASLLLMEKQHYLLVAIISSLAILVHESYLLIGMPLIYLSLFYKYFSKNERMITKTQVIIMLMPVFTFCFLIFHSLFIVDNNLLNKQLYNYLKSIDFIYVRHKGVPHWQTIGISELLKTQKTGIVERIFKADCLMAFFPSLLVFIYFIHSSFKLKAFHKESLLILTVVLSPLMMHAIAFDTPRLSINTIGIGFILLWILKTNKKSFQVDDHIMLILLSVLIVNVFTKVPLLNNKIDDFSNLARFILYLPAILYSASIVFQRNRRVNSDSSEDH